jgi:hypothetical protein
MYARTRPISLTIVSWYLAITGGWALIVSPVAAMDPKTQQIYQSMGVSTVSVILLGVLSGLTYGVAGVMMLRCQEWGRKLYLFGTPASLLLSLLVLGVAAPMMYMISVIVYVVCAIIVTRPRVNAYFSGADEASATVGMAEPDVQEPFDGKKVASILLLFPGTLFLILLFMMIPLLAENTLSLAMMLLFLGGLSSALIVPAIFLWGRRRWSVILGTVLTLGGGCLLTFHAAMLQLTSLPTPPPELKMIDAAMLKAMMRSSLLAGGGFLLIGGLLILLQRVKDNERKTRGVGNGDPFAR